MFGIVLDSFNFINVSYASIAIYFDVSYLLSLSNECICLLYLLCCRLLYLLLLPVALPPLSLCILTSPLSSSNISILHFYNGKLSPLNLVNNTIFEFCHLKIQILWIAINNVLLMEVSDGLQI